MPCCCCATEQWINYEWPRQADHSPSLHTAFLKSLFFFFFSSHCRLKPRRHTELRWEGLIPDNSSSHFTLKLLSGGVTASLLGWGTPLMSSFASRQSAWRLKPQQNCTSEHTYSTFPPRSPGLTRRRTKRSHPPAAADTSSACVAVHWLSMSPLLTGKISQQSRPARDFQNKDI